MGSDLKEKHCWAKVRIEFDDGVVSLIERKLASSLFAGLMLVGPVVFFFVVYFGAFGQSVPQDLIVVAFVMAVPILTTLIVYRPPRVVRFYPNEQVAQRSCRLFRFYLFSRWIDLGGGVPVVRQVRVISKESRSDGGTVAIGCLLMLLGPLGLLLSLGFANSGRQQRVRAYAIKQSETSKRKIAILMKKADAERVVELYEAVCSETPSDLLSDV